jgi:hypothetical protein
MTAFVLHYEFRNVSIAQCKVSLIDVKYFVIPINQLTKKSSEMTV